MNEPLGILGTPHVGFFAIIIIGGLAGWIASMVTHSNHGLFTNILVGIAGSYLGSKLAEILNIAVNGSLMQIAMAVVGSLIIIYVWRMLHPAKTMGPR
jgi:uncharacterized membrane protein YeaQ/YmgE (transglycosylase-associated protein family)